MTKIKKRREKSKTETTNLEEYLKQLPPPPEEHIHELKLEKRIKRLLEEMEKNKAKKESS